MNKDAANVAENLRLGIEAARSGQSDRARTYLTAVLQQDPNNIPALFWSAYVAPSPQESVNLLERVLMLDPNNERARAGIGWAKKRLKAEAAVVAPEPEPESEPQQAPAPDTEETEPGSPQSSEPAPEMPDEFIRQELLTRKDVRQQAQKGALAHRARRTIDPLLVIIFILAAAIVLTMGLWVMAIAPTDTLAAWLPLSAKSVPVNQETSVADLLPATAAAPSDESAGVPAAQNFTSTGDVIVFNTLLPAEGRSSETSVSTPVAGVPPAAAEVLPQQFPPASIAPSKLIGPAEANNELISAPEETSETLQPTEETTELAAPVEETNEENQSAGESPEQNPAVSGPLNEFVEPADEVFNGLKLFEPVDESLLPRKPAYPDEKWIEVNVTLQQITAWEGNVPVMHFIGSTGLPGTPTVLGDYNVYWKLEKTLMAGADYYLPDVPYTMYFYGGYAIHGTYWHENFGQPMSHGCVNLRTEEAKQIFEWADPPLPPGQTQVVSTYDNPGTLVFVHN